MSLRSPDRKEYKGYRLTIYSGQYDSSPHFYFADCRIMTDDKLIYDVSPSTLDPVLVGKSFQPRTAEEAIARLKSDVEQKAREYIDSLAK